MLVCLSKGQRRVQVRHQSSSKQFHRRCIGKRCHGKRRIRFGPPMGWVLSRTAGRVLWHTVECALPGAANHRPTFSRRSRYREPVSGSATEVVYGRVQVRVHGDLDAQRVCSRRVRGYRVIVREYLAAGVKGNPCIPATTPTATMKRSHLQTFSIIVSLPGWTFSRSNCS